MEKLLKMRPHHGMCLQFFIGEGYSNEFVENMMNVSQMLNNNPNTKIILIDKIDIFCGCCPHNQRGVCRTAEKVACYDKKCLEFCGLAFNRILTWNNFKNLVMTNIISAAGCREKICGDCQWNSICQHPNVEKLSKLLKST